VHRTDESAEEEREADLFASHFLMPEEVLEQEWGEARGLSLVDAVLKLKAIFRVSWKTVVYRLAEKQPDPGRVWATFYTAYRRETGKSLRGVEEPRGLSADDFRGSPSPVSRAAEEPESLWRHAPRVTWRFEDIADLLEKLGDSGLDVQTGFGGGHGDAGDSASPLRLVDGARQGITQRGSMLMPGCGRKYRDRRHSRLVRRVTFDRRRLADDDVTSIPFCGHRSTPPPRLGVGRATLVERESQVVLAHGRPVIEDGVLRGLLARLGDFGVAQVGCGIPHRRPANPGSIEKRQSGAHDLHRDLR